MTRVNAGCGQTPTTGWRNFDSSPSVRLAWHPWLTAIARACGVLSTEQHAYVAFCRSNHIERADATRLPVPDGAADVVYCSHMLEHLDRGEVQRFLEECRRVLRPGGVLRVVVPDLRLILEEYLRSGDADRFMEATRLGTRRPANVRDKMNVLVGNGSAHRWMYDGPSLCRLLTSAGFRDPQEVGVGITTISNPEALDLRERAGESVYVEARR